MAGLLGTGRTVTDVALSARSGATGTQAVDRACSLVALVVQASEPLTFTEITDAAGLARSTTSRLLAALERTELVQRDTSGAYVAGSLFALHAARHDPWQVTARVAHPFLERLRDATGETAHLGVPQGAAVLHVAQVDSAYLLATRDWTQLQVPEHCSALGKVLYAHGRLPLPTASLERPTNRSIGDLPTLHRELERVRLRGHAAAVDELELGLTAVAVPVCGRGGEVVAALGVSGPTARLADRVTSVGRMLEEQADALSALLRRHNDRSTRTNQHEEGAADDA
jgi:IclR family transcriptional regulator, acetate operon repressor